MKVKDMFPREYLAAEDLAGKSWTLVMTNLRLEKIWNGTTKEEKYVLAFCTRQGEPTKKRLVLNRTNADRIAEVYGDETDLWMNKPVVIGPSTTRVAGERTSCIRVDVEATKRASNRRQVDG